MTQISDKPILQKLYRGLIVSVQADDGEPFGTPEALTIMARSVLAGGACAVRMANGENIRHFKQACPDIPVIGLTKPHQIPKNYKDLVYITPGLTDVGELAEAGAEIIALDATLRERPGGETLSGIVEATRREFPQVLLMADIATFKEGLNAAQLGFDLISTTLSGYTTETAEKSEGGPDFSLLKSLSEKTDIPVILEGRVWKPWEVTYAFESGAYAVVIGSAITRPHLITRRFLQAIPEASTPQA